MLEMAIVALVVVLAAAFVARRAWATLRPKTTDGCGDGCGCGDASAAASGDWAQS
jgi:hypothetical protein